MSMVTPAGGDEEEKMDLNRRNNCLVCDSPAEDPIKCSDHLRSAPIRRTRCTRTTASTKIPEIDSRSRNAGIARLYGTLGLFSEYRVSYRQSSSAVVPAG